MKLNEIYTEDCITFMRHQEEGVFDVIVTSPPYNIDKDYGKYNDNRTREEYLDWMEMVARESFRALKNGGSFFLNVGGKPSDPWLPVDVASRFRNIYILQNVIHWIKHISIPRNFQVASNGGHGDVAYGHFKPINSRYYLNQGQEYIFHFSKSGRNELDKLAIGVPYQDKSNARRWNRKEDLRDRGNVWYIPYDTKVGPARNPMLHPAEFPPELPEMCIKLHGLKPGMVVYDPFMGVGSTAIACLSSGTSYVGTEIDENYVRIARERIHEAMMHIRSSTASGDSNHKPEELARSRTQISERKDPDATAASK